MQKQKKKNYQCSALCVAFFLCVGYAGTEVHLSPNSKPFEDKEASYEKLNQPPFKGKTT